MLSWTIITIIVMFAVGIKFILPKRRPKFYPPGPMRLPIIGNFHQLSCRPYETFMKMKNAYGNIIAVDFASFPGIVLNDYKTIREGLSKLEFSGRPSLVPFLARCGGDRLRGILFNTGNDWIEQRRFAVKTLRDFGYGKKSKAIESLILDEIKELIATLSDLHGQPMKTQNLFNLAVVNSLWSVISGNRFSHDDARLKALIALFTQATHETPAAGLSLFFPWLAKIAPQMSGFNTFVQFQLNILQVVREAVEKHKATFQNGIARDYVDIHLREILKTKDPNSSFYGQEGVYWIYSWPDRKRQAQTLSWVVLFLSIHPEVQQKLFDEIREVVGLSALPSLSDREKMPYTEALILEVLRKSSLIPLSLFHETTEAISFQKFRIPKNTLIIPNLYAAHHDPEVWGDPDSFRPERFLNPVDGSVCRHSEALMPFSFGKRVCIGEALARDELFLFTTSVFQKFRVEPNPVSAWPDPNDYTGGAMCAPKPYEYILHERF